MINTKTLSIYMQDYKACRGSKTSCTFIDDKNDSIEINSETLYLMFRFMMRELKNNDEWTAFEDGILWRYPGLSSIVEEDI